MADRSVYLNRFTAEHIARLCELNHIDTQEIKTKAERLACLVELPHLIEEEKKQSSITTEELVRVMLQMDMTRKQETEQLCNSFMQAVTSSAPRHSAELSGLHKLSVDDDISCYLNTFERIATTAGKDKVDWPRLLEPYLTGKAQQAFHALSSTDKDNYDEVVRAIKRRYNLTPDAYRVKFKTDSKKGGETFEEFGHRLQDHFFRWLEISESTAEIPEVKRSLNLIMMDQFLSMVSDESLRLKLREAKLQSLNDLSRLADEFVLHRRANSSGGEERNMNRRGFSGFNPPARPTPAPGPGNPPGRRTFNMNCFRCGQLGHRIAECPMPQTRSPTQNSPGVPTPKTGEDCSFVAPQKMDMPMVEIGIKGQAPTPVKIRALVDTGASVSLITTDLCKRLHLSPTLNNGAGTLRMVDGTILAPAGMVHAEVELGGSVVERNFQVVHSLPAEVLLGVDFAKQVGLVLDFSSGLYSTSSSGGGERCMQFPLQGMDHPVVQDGDESFDEVDEHRRPPLEREIVLTGEEKLQLQELVKEFDTVFTTEPGHTDIAVHKIEVGDATPVRSQPYRLGPERKRALEEELDNLLKTGKIEPSTSPWASPVVMVPKKGNKYRMCIDYRKVNAVTKLDAFPMPTVDAILGSLHGAEVFSSLDLRSGYWQMGIAPDDVEKTAFVCEQGLFEFKVLPFGLVNGPASFQRLMSKVLGDLIGQCCYVYLDDIVCFSSSVSQHLADLRSVFRRLETAGLTVNVEKCQLMREEMKYLGHIVSSGGLKPDPEKIAAIQLYPVPTCLKELERFLGMMGWYQKFIPQFTEKAAPLFELKRKGAKWAWNDQRTVAFQTLKEALVTEPILGYPDESSMFTVHTDASDTGLGAVLTQQQPSGNRTIAFASRTLSKAERNYSTTEKECLAVVWALEKWRVYLEGRNCRVISDHQALCWLFRKRKQNGRLARWILRLQDFRFHVVYRPGAQHHVPDALSRIPDMSVVVGVVEVVPPVTVVGEKEETCAADPCLLPDEEVLDWIQCDSCDLWYHQGCVSIKKEEADIVETYSCPSCRKKRTSVTQKTKDRPTGVSQPTLDRHLVIQSQRQDPVLGPIIHKLESSVGTEHPHYRMKEKVLYSTAGCMVIPKELQRQILTEAHAKPTAGHLGRRKTLQRLKDMGVWWQGMSKYVRSFVRSCRICQETKPVYQKKQGKMHSVPATEPWEKVNVDLMGPLPKSYGGHEYILVAVDQYTRFVEVIPLKAASSSSVACTLVREVFCRYGPPKKLISDNGPQFRGKSMRAMCAEWGVEQVFTTPYHPQSNMVERVNRNLKAMLQAYARDDHRQWDVHLAEFSFALNSCRHDTLGVDPARIMFGRRLNTPLTNRLETEQRNADVPDEAELAARQRQATEGAKKHYDKRRSKVQVKEGDRVLIKTFPISNAKKHFCAKLAPRWAGHYIVQCQLTPVTFLVTNELKPEEKRIVHADQMKVCLESVDL